MPPIDAKQIRIIKMAQRDLGMDDAGYRGLLSDLFGVESCTCLSYEQANRLIGELQTKGFRLVAKARPVKSRPKGKNVINLASREELAKIEALADLIPWRAKDGKELFFIKRLGIQGGRVRTAGEAYRAIEGLKKMFENGMARQYGPGWWGQSFGNPAVMEYIRRHRPEEYR
jgi:hypothetical protein